MPVLTEEEVKNLEDKAQKAQDQLDEVKNQFYETSNQLDEANNQKRSFMVAAIILLVLLLGGVGVYFFAPDLIASNQTKIAADEVLVKQSKIDAYEKSISDLENQLNTKGVHPLDLNEFYAVQVGAFKKFNTRLSSDKFSLVRNAQFDDFNIYTLGVFETEEEADELRKIVKQLDFSDAFVGFYKDGERIKSSY
ncbi:MAG: SPOR domain-containing protein [Bacteroidota bacterium]